MSDVVRAFDGLVAVPPSVMDVEVSCNVCVGAWVEFLDLFGNVKQSSGGVYVQEIDVLVVDCDCYFERVAYFLLVLWFQ